MLHPAVNGILPRLLDCQLIEAAKSLPFLQPPLTIQNRKNHEPVSPMDRLPELIKQSAMAESEMNSERRAQLGLIKKQNVGGPPRQSGSIEGQLDWEQKATMEKVGEEEKERNVIHRKLGYPPTWRKTRRPGR